MDPFCGPAPELRAAPSAKKMKTLHKGMRQYYEGLTKRMLSELHDVSAQMSHQGEKGRNNEHVLVRYLRQHLPERYDLTTGKVVSADGTESTQTDVIIRDRINSPVFIHADAWSLVPIETVFGLHLGQDDFEQG